MSPTAVAIADAAESSESFKASGLHRKEVEKLNLEGRALEEQY